VLQLAFPERLHGIALMMLIGGALASMTLLQTARVLLSAEASSTTAAATSTPSHYKHE